MTGYEASQAMRRLETEVRNQKDIRELAKSSGDNVLVKKCNDRIKAYQAKYNEISEITGIAKQPKRMSVPKSTQVLTNSENGGIIHNEYEQSPRKQKNSNYSVKWDKIQTEEYRNRLSNIADNENALSAVETRAKWALNNRDGVDTEELYAINLSNGLEVGRITDQHFRKRIERTADFTNKLNEADSLSDRILLMHNHPDGLPPSINDINALMKNKNVAGITVGHDGSLYYYTRPQTEITVDDWNTALENYERFSQDTAEEKALDLLSKKYGFVFLKL